MRAFNNSSATSKHQISYPQPPIEEKSKNNLHNSSQKKSQEVNRGTLKDNRDENKTMKSGNARNFENRH